MPVHKKALVYHLSVALLAPAAIIPPAFPQTAASQQRAQQSIEPDLLLLEVRLDRHVLSGAITAYQAENDIFLPLSELSRLLTIAIRANPEQGTASGYVLREERKFSLNVSQAIVVIGGKTEPLDTSLVKVEPDDIYVASRLLERWLPLDVEINLSTLSLVVHPLEKLPLQLRLERQDRGSRADPRGSYTDPGYPRHTTPYAAIDAPFIDQTLGVDVRSGNGNARVNAAYTAYLTADLLGMESELYVNSTKQDPSPDVRFTLGRHDPNAGLLGPLQARTFEVGSVSVPGVANISQSSPTGNGVTVSNRPLTRPTSFDRHTLEGDLPPGWDVELYFNDTLVGFQQSRGDGKYSFEDQPLIYGPNEFRLVFHGPLGQIRVERESFLLEQSILGQGELYYSVTDHRDEDGHHRSVAQFDWGLGRNITATGGMVRLPVAGIEQRYTNLGLRGFWQSFIVTGDVARSDSGGTLAQLGVKTRIRDFALSASHARLSDFTSDLFLPTSDPVHTRDQLRIDGAIPATFLPRLPISLELNRDTLESRAENVRVSGRISMYRFGTSLSNTVNWRSNSGTRFADGSFRASRRVAGFGLSSELQYAIHPETELSGIAFSGDKNLSEGYRLSLGLARSFQNPRTVYSAGLSKSLGSYGLSTSASYANDGEYALGVQLFMGMGREPRQSSWITDAQAMAGSGAASARVFLDENQNGVMDKGEEPIPGVGFTVNGGTHLAKTDAAGIAYLNRLTPYQNVDVGLDAITLADPQWVPQRKGMRIVPRPGKVSKLDFPVALTGEIDGTTYLLDKDGKRPIGDLQLELVDTKGQVVATTTSASDGFYIVPAVLPGNYMLRVSPKQLKRLELTHTGMHLVTVEPDGSFVNGRDFVVIPEWE